MSFSSASSSPPPHARRRAVTSLEDDGADITSYLSSSYLVSRELITAAGGYPAPVWLLTKRSCQFLPEIPAYMDSKSVPGGRNEIGHLDVDYRDSFTYAGAACSICCSAHALQARRYPNIRWSCCYWTSRRPR